MVRSVAGARSFPVSSAVRGNPVIEGECADSEALILDGR